MSRTATRETPPLRLVAVREDGPTTGASSTTERYVPGELPAPPGWALNEFIMRSVAEAPRVRLERMVQRYGRDVLRTFKGLSSDLREDLAQDTWRVLLERLAANEFVWFSVEGLEPPGRSDVPRPIYRAYETWRDEKRERKRTSVHKFLGTLLRAKGDRRERLDAPLEHAFWQALRAASGFSATELHRELAGKDVVLFPQAFVRIQAKGVLSNFLKRKRRWDDVEVLLDPEDRRVKDFAASFNVDALAMVRQLNDAIKQDRLAWVALLGELTDADDAQALGVPISELQARTEKLVLSLQGVIRSLRA